MKRFRSRYVRRVLVPAMAVSVLSACTYWRIEEMAPAQVVSEQKPGKIRLTMLDGEKIKVSNPGVFDDRIVGHAHGSYDWATRRHVRSGTLRVPLTSVARIEIRETDALATVLAVLGGLLVAGVIAAAVALSNWDGPMGGCCG